MSNAVALTDETRLRVRIVQDTAPESPRAWGNLGVMACWHPRYNLGDVQPQEPPDEWLKEHVPPGSIVLPLHLYDHSGITMRTSRFSCPWDSGQVGWLVATPEAVRKAYGVKRLSKKTRELATKCLEAEVRIYDAFLTGDVWGYEVCGPGHDDSCFGFFGDDVEGMRYHLAPELHEALDRAWAHRGEPTWELVE